MFMQKNMIQHKKNTNWIIISQNDIQQDYKTFSHAFNTFNTTENKKRIVTHRYENIIMVSLIALTHTHTHGRVTKKKCYFHQHQICNTRKEKLVTARICSLLLLSLCGCVL